MNRSPFAPLAGILLAAAPLAARAVDVYEGPARFARAQSVQGRVAIGHAYEDDFVDLHDNEPVGEGDKLSLPDGSRALIIFPDGSRLAASGPARLELIRISARRPYELRVHDGEIFVESAEDRRFYIDSPEGGFSLGEDAQATLDLGRDGLRVGVLRGDAEAGDEGSGESIGAGQSATLRDGEASDLGRIGLGMGEPLKAWANAAGRSDEDASPSRRSRGDEGDDEDEWADRRRDRDDRRRRDEDGDEDRDWREARRDLSPEVGYYFDELSHHGRWRWVPGYGWAWRPYRVARGWVPFTAGFWRYTPWGMFWVSYEPWGWAPYRYGAWRFDPRWGWFWVPGPRFGGAWVLFYSQGDDWGWCPAYYDYGEWWPSSSTYIQINIINVYNYHPQPRIINLPPPRRPVLGRPVMPAPPVGGGFTRHLPVLGAPGRTGMGGPRIEPPPVRPAGEVWRGRPVLGRPAGDGIDREPPRGAPPDPPRGRPTRGDRPPTVDGNPVPRPHPTRGGPGTQPSEDGGRVKPPPRGGPAPRPGGGPEQSGPRESPPPSPRPSGGGAADRPVRPPPRPAPEEPPRPRRGAPPPSAPSAPDGR